VLEQNGFYVAWTEGSALSVEDASAYAQLDRSRRLIGRDESRWRYLSGMGTKAERRAAQERVAAYHVAELGELIEFIAAAVDGYRAGDSDAYDVDETIHRYHRAARELWKFCWSGGGGTQIEIAAQVLDRMASDGETINWWERGAPRQRS
jgi:hypothetical protein